MKKTIEDLLFNTDIDLTLSDVLLDDPFRFTVRTKISLPRIALSLLFGIPCIVLFVTALRHQGFFLLMPLVFCPPMAILAVLIGLSVQEKTFDLSKREAIRGFRLPGFSRSRSSRLPETGTVVTYKTWSSGDSGGCYFYHVSLKEMNGFGFTVSRDEQRRNNFARELAEFLDYGIQDLGEMSTVR